MYRHLINAFEAKLTAVQAELLSNSSLVRAVYQDSYVEGALSDTPDFCFDNVTTINGEEFLQLPDGAPRVQTIACSDPTPTTGSCADNWGLDRTDQYSARNGSYTYIQDSTDVRVFVIDSGIGDGNREFTKEGSTNNRVEAGWNMTTCNPFPVCPDPGDSDCIGHGTHVAAIIGGRTYGIARDVSLVPIVFACGDAQTQNTFFARALEYTASVHLRHFPTAIVNISGGNAWTWVTGSAGDYIRPMMLELAKRDNVLIVQSAGNYDTRHDSWYGDACVRSFGDETVWDSEDAPYIARILVVGGSDENDERWKWVPGDGGNDPLESCWGPCADIWAPGAHIVSAAGKPGIADPVHALCRLSGTSMAAPHVSGIAADDP